MTEAPTFALRYYHYIRSKTSPEPSLLNSFYIADLAQAERTVSAKGASGLRRYLAAEAPPPHVDVLHDVPERLALVSPGRLPAARWPATHPLVFLQQAAVGAIRQETEAGRGLVAVNGPPGTGKTTLLRDVIAACILDRAMAMATLKDPCAAFSNSGLKVSAGPAFFQIYRLDPNLRGHEIVVASSNNKAVENVSRELPGLSALGEQISYFQAISDALADERVLNDSNQEEPLEPRPQTWGLIAAVLGNAANRYAFQQVFWRHDEWSFRLYLKAAKGDDVHKTDDVRLGGRKGKPRLPLVVAREQPPSEAQAKRNWRAARARFLALKEQIEVDCQQLEEAKTLQDRLNAALALLRNPSDVKAQAEALTLAAQQALGHANTKLEFAQNDLGRFTEDLTRQERLKPGFVERMLGGQDWRTWQALHDKLASNVQDARLSYEVAMQRVRSAQADLLEAQRSQESMLQAGATARAEAATLGAQLAHLRTTLGNGFIDSDTFRRGHESWNLSAPWATDTLQAREFDNSVWPHPDHLIWPHLGWAS